MAASGAVPSADEAPSRVSFLVFCVYTFIMIGRPQDYFPVLEPLRPALLFTIISVAVTALVGLHGSANAFRHRTTKLYLFFFAVMVAGVPFSMHRRLSLDFVLLGYLVNVVYFLLFVINVDTLAKFKRIVFVVVLSALMFSGLALQNGSFSGGRYFAKLGVSRRGRVIGVGFDPNDIAFVVVSLLSFALCVLLGTFRRLSKIIALSTIVLGVLLALYTGSRGGILGLATFLLLFLVVRIRGLSKLGKLSMIVVLALTAVFNADKINVDRYLTLSEVASDYNSTTEFGRIGIWRRGLQLFADNPLTGVGVGRFGQAIGMERKDENVLAKWQASHNSYLQVITELGTFGAAAFLLLIITCITNLVGLMRKVDRPAAKEVNTYAAILLVGFIAQLLTAFFLSQAYSILLTLSFAVATALSGIAKPSGSTTDGDSEASADARPTPPGARHVASAPSNANPVMVTRSHVPPPFVHKPRNRRSSACLD
jgi:O-antigen ligase